MNNLDLRLHISTPLGVAYDELVSNVQVKVSDGYYGVNKNRLPSIQKVVLSKMIIRKLNSTEQVVFLVGEGIMTIDKYECNIYTEFLIDPTNPSKSIYMHNREALSEKLKVLGDQYEFTKKEVMLKKELGKFKKI